jgi:rare lipoprotein A (peptidoglycan hydrolase)
MVWRRAALASICCIAAGAAGAEVLPPAHPQTQTPPRFSDIGMASWYGGEFHGRQTADGEIFDTRSISAAHRTLPLPCYARVTNLRNGRSIIVRVNDRGPFIRGRILDVSARVARLLEFSQPGLAKVRIDYVGKAAPAGSDEAMLIASLQTGAAPEAAKPQTRIARSPPTEGETIVARTVEVEPRSPYGELVVSPFLIRSAGP